MNVEIFSQRLAGGKGGGGGLAEAGRNSHIKATGMLVVLLRGVNFEFWTH